MKQKKFKMCETNRYIFGTWGVTHFFFYGNTFQHFDYLQVSFKRKYYFTIKKKSKNINSRILVLRGMLSCFESNNLKRNSCMSNMLQKFSFWTFLFQKNKLRLYIYMCNRLYVKAGEVHWKRGPFENNFQTSRYD